MYVVRRNARWQLLFSLVGTGLLLIVLPRWLAAQAQAPTLTALPISIPSRTPTPLPLSTVTPTRTPTTGVSLLRVEAITEARIRTAPDLNAQILESVKPGKFFNVVGRRAKWIQIVYPAAPSGRAWVYEDVIKYSGGDPKTIPELDAGSVPTANVQTAAVQLTAQFITGTPGAPGTATAIQAVATGVFTAVAANTTPSGPLPTFTFPAPMLEPTLPARASAVPQGGLPPIVPIIGLGVLGVFGLLISVLRRG